MMMQTKIIKFITDFMWICFTLHYEMIDISINLRKLIHLKHRQYNLSSGYKNSFSFISNTFWTMGAFLTKHIHFDCWFFFCVLLFYFIIIILQCIDPVQCLDQYWYHKISGAVVSGRTDEEVICSELVFVVLLHRIRQLF